MRIRCALIVGFAALAACGSSSGMSAPAGASSSGTSAQAGASANCGPSGARTLAADGRATVYISSGHVYGCAASTRRRYLLGASERTIREGRVGPVALAGVDVAYGLSRFGVDTGSTQVTVRRLTDGKLLHTAPATSSVAGPEAYQSIGALVVKPDGAVAWIGASNSIVGHGHGHEVHRYDRRGQDELDRGTGIAGTSLRLHGSRLTWMHSGRVRSATLS
jgi:hypothetical protein